MNVASSYVNQLRELQDERDGLLTLLEYQAGSDAVQAAMREALDLNIERTKRLLNMQADCAKECPACKRSLRTNTRGRGKYCAYCGCYIPQILFDERT